MRLKAVNSNVDEIWDKYVQARSSQDWDVESKRETEKEKRIE